LRRGFRFALSAKNGSQDRSGKEKAAEDFSGMRDCNDNLRNTWIHFDVLISN
jgi:hypothetical protein